MSRLAMRWLVTSAVLLPLAGAVAQAPGALDLAAATGCDFHCLATEPVDRGVQWHYIDGGGRAHALGAGEGDGRLRAQTILGDGDGLRSGCGSDGYGWRFGEVIASAMLPDGSALAVRYLGRALAMAELRDATGDMVSAQRVAAGEAPQIAPACREARVLRDGRRID